MDNLKKIKIGIAEDQVIFRDGLVRMLNNNPDFEVVCEAENGKILIEEVRRCKPDICLVDYRMPELNGIETTKAMKLQYPEIKIILLSMYDDAEFVESAIENGANGYLSKDDDPSEIEKALYSTHEIGYYLNDRTSKVLITRLVEQGKINPKFVGGAISFSEEEIRVIRFISQELTTQEIADLIFKSVRTVENMRTVMMNRVGAKNIVGLVMYAVKHNLI
jgi:two-component system, NarL family, response regulator NreC